MEVGERGGKELREKALWIPTTPLKPILPKPVPIYTPCVGNQLSSHANGVFACFQSSPIAEINSRQPRRRSAPAAAVPNIAGDSARTCAQISFDNTPSWSNVGFVEHMAMVNAPSATHGGIDDGFSKDQFVPTFMPQFNSNLVTNPTYPLLSSGHLSLEQPLINTNHGNHTDPQGTSYSAYCRKTTFQVAPPTPDNAIGTESRQVAATHMNMEEMDQGREEKNAPGTGLNINETPCNKELCDPVTEFAAASTPLKENHNLDKISNHGVDLNKTPQQKPRRRKHRPKVITEGKPKRTHKSVTPNHVLSKENITGKRKNAIKKGSNTHSTPTEGAGELTKPFLPESAKKTCRRSLNFDIGEQPRDENSACKENATTYLGKEIGVVVEETHIGLAYDLNTSMKQGLNNCISSHEDTQAPSTSLSKGNPPVAKPNANSGENGKRKGQVTARAGHENSAKIPSKPLAQSSPNYSNSCNSRILTTGLQMVGSKREHSHTVDHSDTGNANLIETHHNGLHEQPRGWVLFPNIQKKRRSEKGKNSNTSNTFSVTATKDVQLATCPQEDTTAHPYALSSSCWVSGPECNAAIVPVIIKAAERDIHDVSQTYILSRQTRQTKRKSRIPPRYHDCALLTRIRNCHTNLSDTAKQPSIPGRQTFGDAQRLETPIDALVAETCASLTKKKRTTKKSSLVSSAYGSTNELQQHHKFVLGNHNLPLSKSLDVSSKVIWKNIHTMDALTEQIGHLNINREARDLVFYGQNALVPYNEQNQKPTGLVHGDGTIIPFEGSFNPVKKEYPRPKVDLDEETNRVWKLLMLNINSQGIDGTDEDKAKWWEEERNVFRGRADSFIARMHLVQGDRRFSQWKGSVVDSVVGVFLTQNVSDHLSSSAFMSLAARFPLKSSRKGTTYQAESSNLIVNKPQVHIVEPEKNTELDEKMLNQPIYDLSSVTIDIIEHSGEKTAVNRNDSCRATDSLISFADESACKLLESAHRNTREHHGPVKSGAIHAMGKEGREKSSDGGIRNDLKDIISSKCSVISSHISGDCSIYQNPETLGSCSESNSEQEHLSSATKHNIFYDTTPFSKLLGTMLYEVNSQRSKSAENLQDAYGQYIVMKHDKPAENLEKSNVTQDCLEASIIPPNEYTLKMTPNSGLLEVNCYDPLKIEVSSSGLSKNKRENDMNRPSVQRKEFASQTAITHSQSMLSHHHLQEQSNQKQQNFSHISGQTQDLTQKEMEIEFGDHNHIVRNESSAVDYAPIKSKSKGHAKEKKHNFNWDSLRIQAQTKAGKRENTEDTMDSLDWDAVRCADVNEIANAIKERGMNNMLAERIKNFLNLLFEVHGSIDLEWLRDVPPDQAKEYLLSIKGLGLKSVECVRLLTLHHLAFPVDTNVGRIAVRLGWVPLQPLPESLQLHLLELYPVLESIQKYLWPRLCKLEQRTLYELHYQMITFGKVFCTKSKPNCNACPMRGECRHFASAFASARLALPGPEKRSMVSKAGNNATDQNPPVIISQSPLPLPPNTTQAEEIQQTEGSKQLEAKSYINICQPIIEEPATPEPECSQLSEHDIEDAFYEDSGEIPTIRLNMEEFTLNLRNYMQENVGLQEGVMSKALVALNPEAARIPMPKLKNVSRLRTEHCVYELPDSHHLLEGWDKREPDDPGKYLLAIWTPGETANSMLPPESKCNSQECGKLCNEKECFSCNSFREVNSQIVRGTLLIPCRTAMRGSFPLNGTYFQVNEVFADQDSSLNPLSVPRSWIWNLNRRTVYFGTSIPTIFKGLSTQEIQQCFWRGYVCVRGFDRQTRAPRPLMARLHFPASKLTKTKKESTSANSQGLKPNL